MQSYRVYIMSREGRIDSPAQVIECADDDMAVKFARQSLDGKAIEVWEGVRRIARLEPKDGKAL